MAAMDTSDADATAVVAVPAAADAGGAALVPAVGQAVVQAPAAPLIVSLGGKPPMPSVRGCMYGTREERLLRREMHSAAISASEDYALHVRKEIRKGDTTLIKQIVTDRLLTPEYHRPAGRKLNPEPCNGKWYLQLPDDILHPPKYMKKDDPVNYLVWLTAYERFDMSPERLVLNTVQLAQTSPNLLLEVPCRSVTTWSSDFGPRLVLPAWIPCWIKAVMGLFGPCRLQVTDGWLQGDPWPT